MEVNAVGSIRTWAVVIGMVAFIVVAPLAMIGYLWHVRDAAPHKTKWNERYSQPTFPLDDDPTTNPDPSMWAIPSP